MRLALAALLLCACAAPARYALPEVDAAAVECVATGGEWACSRYRVEWDGGGSRATVVCVCDR